MPTISGTLRPLKNTVFVTQLEQGPQRTSGGIIIPDDNMKDSGIRERWGKVYAVGPEVEDLKPGEWVYIKHGRWTFGFDLETPKGKVRVWRIDYPEAVLLVADGPPSDRMPAKLELVRNRAA